ncbi:Protein MAIN-LIKE 1 [Glycine max]|nr:Protein MAIN-LIKE 1 [Glycine max]
MIVWNEEVAKFDRPALEIEGLVAVVGLSPLIAFSLDIGYRGLISGFVERWHKETSSFHLPIGEVTITLDDVASLLHLPIIGAFHSFEALHMNKVLLLLTELLEVSSEEARAKTWTVTARAYLLHLVGCTPFANKSVTHVHVVFLDVFRDLIQSESYAWGVVALVHMYGNLNDPSKSSAKQLAGYITLLETIPPHPAAPTLCIEDIDDRWIQFFEYLAPVGQICVALGQCVTDYMEWFYMISHPFMSSAQPRDLPKHLPVLHDDTFIEPDIPQHPVVAGAMDEALTDAPFHVEQPRHVVHPVVARAMDEALTDAPAHVEQPRHALACQAIAERLERLLNLRIVTKGT